MITRRLSTLAMIAVLALTGCSETPTETEVGSTTAVETSTVVSTTQSDEERIRAQLDSMAPVNQVNAGNLRDHCIMAIADELDDPGDLDFPRSITMEPDPEVGDLYSATGDFRYEDSQDIWRDGSYYCQATTSNGAITDTLASVTTQ